MQVEDLKDWLKLAETEHVLNRLSEESAILTYNLKKIDKSNFDHEVGLIQGIDLAISIITKIAEEEEERRELGT